MKIIFVESRNLDQFHRIDDDEAAARQCHCSFQPQLFQHPVDMDRGHPQRICQHDLRQGERKLFVVAQVDVAGAQIELAHQMRDALDARTPANAGNPGTHRAFIDQLRQIHGPHDPRMLVEHCIHLVPVELRY